MISIIISFRFSKRYLLGEHQKEAIEKTLNYWKLMKDFFNLELVFINDHSDDLYFTEPFIHPMPGDKRDWNQPAARNYGATIANGQNLLFTDIDHIIYGDFSSLEASIQKGFYIIFKRKLNLNETYQSIHDHKNTFLIKKDEFIRYDEEFCGNYGHDDSEFFYRLNKTHHAVHSTDVTAYLTNLRSVDCKRDLTINRKLLHKKIGVTE